MKKLLCLSIMLLSLTTIAQTKKKAPFKKPTAKAAAKVEAPSKPASPCTVDNAGKYAKELANKMYYTEPVYGDKRRGLNVQIIDWKGLQADDGGWFYFIKLNLTWQEGTGGWGDWKNVSYKGTMVADQFGCNALYMIDEKVEPSIFGIIKRARKLTDEQRQVLSAKDDWAAGVQYYWEPEGCLD